MQVKVDIEIDELIKVIKTLPKAQLNKLKAEITGSFERKTRLAWKPCIKWAYC